MNPEHVRSEMAKLNPSNDTETSLDRANKGWRADPSETHDKKAMAAKCIHKLCRCAEESKGICEGADDREQEEVHLKLLHPKVRRDARQLKVLGSFIATHDNVPRKDSSGRSI